MFEVEFYIGSLTETKINKELVMQESRSVGSSMRKYQVQRPQAKLKIGVLDYFVWIEGTGTFVC